MPCRDLLRSLLCCCVEKTISKTIKKRHKEHKYCGCRESSKQGSKMQTCDIDKRSLVDNEVVEALEYDFQHEEQNFEECLIEDTIIPFNHLLRTPLHPQSDIILQGALDKNAIRFSINLVVARGSSDDIAFHFNPRLDQQYSARNSLLFGKWGQEEGNSQTKFPFIRGQSFFIEIFLTHTEFMVAVNGTHYCSYTYRTSLLNITGLQVFGGVHLKKVHLTNCVLYPTPLPADFPPSPYKFSLRVPGCTENTSQDTPLYGILEGKLEESCKIEINGKVKLLPISFYVNLQEGTHLWPHPDIPLHISVRFHNEKPMVVANAWHDDTWNAELTCSTNLLTPGIPFKMVIECQRNAYVVKFNEEIILIFNHQVPFSVVDTVHVQGDVFIYDISIAM